MLSVTLSPTGSVDDVDRHDYYKVVLTEPGQTVYVNSTVLADVTITLTLCDNLEYEWDGEYSVSAGILRVEWCFETAQTVYIHIERNGGAGRYTLAKKTDPAQQ